MLIDCDSCMVRGLACSDCVVTVLLNTAPPGQPEPAVELDAAEQSAIAALSESGLVPPLRLAAVDPDLATRRLPRRHGAGGPQARRDAG